MCWWPESREISGDLDGGSLHQHQLHHQLTKSSLLLAPCDGDSWFGQVDLDRSMVPPGRGKERAIVGSPLEVIVFSMSFGKLSGGQLGRPNMVTLSRTCSSR